MNDKNRARRTGRSNYEISLLHQKNFYLCSSWFHSGPICQDSRWHNLTLFSLSFWKFWLGTTMVRPGIGFPRAPNKAFLKRGWTISAVWTNPCRSSTLGSNVVDTENPYTGVIFSHHGITYFRAVFVPSQEWENGKSRCSDPNDGNPKMNLKTIL